MHIFNYPIICRQVLPRKREATMGYPFFLLIGTIFWLTAIVFIKTVSDRKHITNMIGMVVAMTLGMGTGLLLGVIFGVLFSGSLFLSNIYGMIGGIVVGFLDLSTSLYDAWASRIWHDKRI